MKKTTWAEFIQTPRYVAADVIEVTDERGNEISDVDGIKPYAIVKASHMSGGVLGVEVINLKVVGHYAMGLCGYEILSDGISDSEYLYARYVGPSKEESIRKYKVQYPASNGAPFIRPNGTRIRLNEVLGVSSVA